MKNRLRSIMVKAIDRINTHGDVAMMRTKDELDLIVRIDIVRNKGRGNEYVLTPIKDCSQKKD